MIPPPLRRSDFAKQRLYANRSAAPPPENEESRLADFLAGIVSVVAGILVISIFMEACVVVFQFIDEENKTLLQILQEHWGWWSRAIWRIL